MITFLQVITESITDLLLENFYFYLPPIYQTILNQISKNEHSKEFAIFITYTAKAKHVYLLTSCLYEMLSLATRRLIQLNHLEPYLMNSNDICRIRDHCTTTNTYLQLLGIFTDQKEVKEVITIRYHKTTTEKFKEFFYTLDCYQPLKGWQCNILQRILATYNVEEIHEAIEYENLMNLYDTYTISDSDTEQEEFHLNLLPQLTSF